MHLFNVYVAINKELDEEIKEEKRSGAPSLTDRKAKEVFRLMEGGDEEALSLWNRFRTLSIRVYEKVYERLNVHFDVYAGESLVSQDVIRGCIQTLRDKNLVTSKRKEEGRQWDKENPDKGKTASNVQTEDQAAEDSDSSLALAIDLTPWKLEKPVVEKPDGTTIYTVRDIAGAIQRYDQYHFDKMIYVVGDQQALHVAQFFKILALMEAPFSDRLEHISFGKVHGMSTRRGEVKFLEDIHDASKEVMLAQITKNETKANEIADLDYTSDQIGMTCVKIQDMQAKRIHSYHFDLQRMTSFEGDTGAYLQYAHVRLASIQRKVAPAIILRDDDPSSIDTSLLTEPIARELVFVLTTYPHVVRTAIQNHEPSTIVSYCFRISHLVSSAWEILIVMGQEPELAQARLYLFTCTRYVLGSAIRLLSLTPLDRM